MKVFTRTLFFVVLSCLTQGVNAAQTFISVFFEKGPMQGIEVVVDDNNFDVTNSLGRATISHNSGDNSIVLLRDGQALTTISYKTSESEEAEISVTFTNDSTDADFTVRVLDSNDQSAIGSIGGIISTPSGSPLSDATVEVNGQAVTTDSSGVYEIDVPRGAYTVSASHPEYSNNTADDVRVLADVGSAVSFKLLPKRESNISIQQPVFSAPAEEMIITGTYKRLDTSADIERFSTNVVDALDVEQLARVGDANVASAITRLVGVTVTGGKYANVRGLDGRYISSSLNGFLMPSTDPMRRDVQLDLFPSNILSGVEVQKSYSSNLLGTTTAGQLKVKTLGLPDDLTTKISASIGANYNFTGTRVISYESSNTDGFGFDSGLRTLSKQLLDATENGSSLTICDPAVADFCTSERNAARLGLLLENDYNVHDRLAQPDYSIGLAHGNKLPYGDNEVGYYLAANFKRSTDSRDEARLNDTTDTVGTYDRSDIGVSATLYGVVGIEFRDEDEIVSKTMFFRDTNNKTEVKDGIEGDEDNLKNEVVLEWVERQFFSEQIVGKHLFKSEASSHHLDWRIGFSNTFRYEPDRRTYQFLNSNFNTSSVERRWSELDEDSIDVGIDYTYDFDFSDSVSSKVFIGALISDKSRDVELYRFGVRGGPNFGEVNTAIGTSVEEILSYENFINQRIVLSTITTDTDSYNADEKVEAYYVNWKTDFDGKWIVQAGVRQENFSQELRYPNETIAASSLDSRAEQDLDESNVLPAITLTYIPSEQWQIRAGFSQTVSYPGIVERSESGFYDQVTSDFGQGNSDLKISEIDNTDLRVEYYFSDESSVSLAYFIKDIANAVERTVIDGSGSSSEGFTFRNATVADVSGFELDANTTFETDNWLYSISGNISFIDSEVTLDERSAQLEGSDGKRDLQGQSPYLANLQFGFDHLDSEQKFTVLINSFDDRIFQVGRGVIDNEIEKGRTLVNLNYEKVVSDSATFKASAKNILNSKVKYSRSNTTIESYETGASFSVGINYEF